MSVSPILTNTTRSNNLTDLKSPQKFSAKQFTISQSNDEFLNLRGKRKKQFITAVSVMACSAVLFLAVRKGMFGKSLKKVFGGKADDLSSVAGKSEKGAQKEIMKPQTEMTEDAKRIYNIFNSREDKWAIEVVEGESDISRYFREMEIVSDNEKSKKGLFKRVKRGLASIGNSCEKAWKKCFSKNK